MESAQTYLMTTPVSVTLAGKEEIVTLIGLITVLVIQYLVLVIELEAQNVKMEIPLLIVYA